MAFISISVVLIAVILHSLHLRVVNKDLWIAVERLQQNAWDVNSKFNRIDDTTIPTLYRLRLEDRDQIFQRLVKIEKAVKAGQ